MESLYLFVLFTISLFHTHTHMHTRTHECTHARTRTVTITLRQGYPMLSVPLPSKRESCDFTLRPHLHSVGDFLQHLQTEDKGVERSVWVGSM